MSVTVSVKNYDAPAVDRREILRYAGVRGDAPELETLLTSCLGELLPRLSYRVCFAELPLRVEGDEVILGEARVRSVSLARQLRGCSRAVLFAATVGNEPDRLIARYQRISPSRALLIQAIGSERAEAVCDRLEEEIKTEQERRGGGIRRRFSPGYGDLPLSFQQEVFRLLDCPKHVGISLNESLLMSPSKSVTAVIGVEEITKRG